MNFNRRMGSSNLLTCIQNDVLIIVSVFNSQEKHLGCIIGYTVCMAHCIDHR